MRVSGGGEKEWSRFLASVPRLSALAASAFAHVAALAIIILLQHVGYIHIQPVRYAVVRIDAGRGHAGPAYLPAKPGQGQPLCPRTHHKRKKISCPQPPNSVPY